MKKRILLIGSEGYIGSALKNYLLRNGHIVYTTDIVPSSAQEYNHYTLKYGSHTVGMVESSYIDTIILLAGFSSVQECIQKSWMEVYSNNVENFNQLLNELKVRKYKGKILYASSASVYGNLYDRDARETDPLAIPHNNYDASKQIIDLIASRYYDDLEIYGLRFATVNGPSPKMRWELLLNSMYKTAINEKKIICSDPSKRRSFLDMDDLCDAIQTIIVSEKQNQSGVYNISTFGSTIGNFVRKSAEILNVPFTIENSRFGTPYDFVICNEKINDVFDWVPKGSIMQTLKNLKKIYEARV